MDKKAVFRWILFVAALLLPIESHAVEGIDGPTWYDYRDTSFDITGKGTFDNPIVISTAEQLAQLAYLVNEEGNDMDGKVIVLGADINLKKEVDGQRVKWVPIGCEEATPFKGFFLGIDVSKLNDGSSWTADMSHTVSGMYLSGSSTTPYRRFYYGLIGHSAGFVGYLRLTDSELNFTSKYNGYQHYLGLLCGRTHKHIYNVSVEGNVNIDSRNTSTYLGGIAGYVGVDGSPITEAGIAHSTFKGRIDAKIDGSVGGICGELFYANLTDCASEVNIRITPVGVGDNCFTGGTVGYACADARVNACTSAGTVTGNTVGGIVGFVSDVHTIEKPGTVYITSCASSCTLEGTDIVGGILASSEDNPAAHVFSCAFSGHINGSGANRVGGIAGVMPQVKDELLSHCIMTGTIEPTTGYHALTGGIVGEAVDAHQTIANCYYDSQLFTGRPVGNEERHVTIKGLTTVELITGKADDLPLLASDDAAKPEFTLRKGYYPAVCSDEGWRSILQFIKPAGDSEWLNKMFDKDFVDQSNTVYRYGAWLCSVPAIIPKGDVAADLVTQVSVPTKNGEWTEGSRSVAVESTVAYPESAEFLKIDGKTAEVTADGQFGATIGGKLTAKAADVFNRPAPLITSKTLHFNSTLGQLWDGSIAASYADGKGLREDPYIIKNGAQLALAVTTNKEGECFRQICDINLNTNMFDDDAMLISSGKKQWEFREKGVRIRTCLNGYYDGGGHIIRGLYLAGSNNALFGDVAASGTIVNLGVAESTFNRGGSGMLALNMDGKITNCFVQGAVAAMPTNENMEAGNWGTFEGGGICAYVGPNNPEAVIEDCITAVFNQYAYSDYNPFVCLSNNNKGVVRNCLSVVPVFYANTDWSHRDYTAEGQRYIQDCYWLRGYEVSGYGHSLETICDELGSRERWTVTKNYFPTLKTFAETDIAKLMMVPVRTDAFGYNAQTIDGFTRYLEFEPGAAQWTPTGRFQDLIEADSDMGVIVPHANAIDPASPERPQTRLVAGLVFLKGTLGKSSIYLPMRTNSFILNRGITFDDDNAASLCLRAFDSDGDGNLSLAEVTAVTATQAATAFQAEEAKLIKTFPELRYFKNITRLTTHLNNMSALEDVRLPFALKTVGSDAFMGCTSLKEVTLPSKVSYIEPHPFYGSAVANVKVDLFNENLKSRDGLLFDANNGLLAYPNGRSGEEATVSGVISTIYEGAFYQIEGLKRLYLDFDDYDHSIPELEYGGIETTDGDLIEVYAKDGSDDHAILDELCNDPSWSTYSSAKKLLRYYPLIVGDNNATTMYVGFDVKLPDQLTPYIVSSTIPARNVALLQEMERRVPKLSPVVIMANEPGLYHLYPIDGAALKPWKMYQNRLNGSGADGIPIYAEDSAEGGIYSLQNHKQYGIPYFDYCQDEMFPPYHAYLPYNSIGDDLEMGVHFLLSQEINVGDFQMYAIPNSNSSGDGLSPTYTGVLSDYDGTDHNIVVPASFKASVFDGEPTDILIEGLGPNIFADPENEIWSVDFTQIAKPLKAYDFQKGMMKKEIVVDRHTENNPFYGLDKQAYIYLNSADDIGSYESNVVIDGRCDYLDLIENRDFMPPFDISTEILNLGRTFPAAIDDYRRPITKAYSVCLPFTTEVKDGTHLYTLRSVDEKQHRFIFVKAKDNVIEAGKPYIMTVDSGMVQISKNNIDLKRAVSRTDVTALQTGNSLTNCGYWDGTYANIDNATAAGGNAYVLQPDGTFRRVREKMEETALTPFQAFFTTGGNKAIDPASYTMVLCDDDDLYAENAEPFPAGAYDTTGDIGSYDIAVSALWCAADSTLYFTAKDGYETGGQYDGRTISALWSGYDLLDLGKDEPGWTTTAAQAQRVVFDSSFATLRPRTLHAWFKGMESLKTIEGIEHLNTTMTKDMSQMFQGCASLEVLDLSTFAVNVTDATQMFQGCTNLTTIFAEGNWTIHFDGDDEIFDDCYKLVGARTYNEGYTDNYWANSVVGYFTPTPYAVWCADNATLYFAAPGYHLDTDEDLWDGEVITTLWKGFDVAYNKLENPAWVSPAKDARRVVFDDSFAKVRPRSLNNWFYMFRSLQQMENLEYLNTSEATEAQGMFYGCSLSEVDVNSFDMGKMVNADWMFGSCQDLTTIWCNNTWNIPQADNMFADNANLKGAVAFDRKQKDGLMANPLTGYFTAIPTVELRDGQDNYDELFAQYDGKHVNISYNRKFTATRNDDGSWSRKAYSVCLPYDKSLSREHNRGQMSLYTLASVTEEGGFIFAEVMPTELKAGQPYILVVNEGELNLNADYVKLTSKLSEGSPVYATFDDWAEQNEDKQVGLWKGTYTSIYPEDAEPLRLYGMSASAGRWYPYKTNSGGYHFSKLISLRGIFESTIEVSRNFYQPQYGYMPDGPSGARYILEFPAEEFDGDNIDDDPDGILSIGTDNDADIRYFNLQGRPLSGKPAKGLYIEIQPGKKANKIMSK